MKFAKLHQFIQKYRSNSRGALCLKAALIVAACLALAPCAIGGPLHLDENNPLTVSQGGSGTITASLLDATDTQAGPSDIYFTINPQTNGGPPFEGTLFDNGVPLTSFSVFTMADVNNNLITYQNAGTNCATQDNFQMGITDNLGNVWSDQGYTTFSFNINITPVARAPVALDSSLVAGLGASASGSLTASNGDCVNLTLTYSIVTPPAKGSLTAFNASAGTYTYTATLGQSGSDSFTFSVSNGVLASAAPGTVSVQIQEVPPVASPGTFSGKENTALNATLQATDSDLPAPTLTYSIVAQASKGTAVITGPTNGAFVYTPQPGRFGLDSFSFMASDGVSNSMPATVTIFIQPTGVARDWLLVADDSHNWLAAINPANGDAYPVSAGGLFTSLDGVAFEPAGTVLVTDHANGLIRVNPATGAQTMVVSNSMLALPIGVAVEATGNILVADVEAGVKRFTAAGVLLTNFPKGSLVAPAGVAVAPGGQIFVSDAAAFLGNPSATKIVQYDPVTLNQTVLSAVNLLTAPIALAVEPAGSLVSPQATSGNVVRIAVPGGAQSLVSNGTNITGGYGVGVASTGAIYVASQSNGEIVEVDPVTGIQTVIPTGGLVVRPFGLAVAGAGEAPRFTAAAFPTPGQFQIQFNAEIGSSNSVLAATNLSAPGASWMAVGVATEVSPGAFQFTDTMTSNFPVKFYKIVTGNGGP